MPASALLAAVSVASLNLCADEYLLLLARRGEIASVSYLSQDPLESPLWKRARGLHANQGSIEQVIGRRPSAVLTMGGGGRATATIARRMGVSAFDLRYASSFADVAWNLRSVAGALGEPGRADPWIRRLEHLQRTMPGKALDTLWISGGGQSFPADSLNARWLRLAGLRQRADAGDRVSLETLLVSPPAVIVQSDYRRRQVSRSTRWLDHPIVRRTQSRRLITDGRAWTCLGPLLIPEIARLRALLR